MRWLVVRASAPLAYAPVRHSPGPTTGARVAPAGAVRVDDDRPVLWWHHKCVTPWTGGPGGPFLPVPWGNALRRDQSPGPRHRSGGDGGMARLVRRHRRRQRQGPGALPPHEAPGAGAHKTGRVPGHRLDALREQHPGRRRAVVPRRRIPGAPHPRLYPLERRRHGGPGQHAHRGHRRAPVDLRQLGGALRGRLQSFLPRQGRRRLRRPGLLPGACVTRHLRPGLRRGPPDRDGARQLPPRGRR